jgi:hypothetical protein
VGVVGALEAADGRRPDFVMALVVFLIVWVRLASLPTGVTDLLCLNQFLHVPGKAGLEIDDFGPG